jgi:SAM-dependent methyltransferase
VHSSAESVVTQLLQTGGEKGGDTTERPLNVLDAGCGVGQNLRYLSTALGGFERDLGLYGIDLSDAWFDIGYQLFRDRSTLHATLVCANLLDATSQQEGEGISQLHGRMDMIIADNLFHLFSRDDQIRVATQLIRCSRACPGASIRGVHAGASEAHHYRPAHQHQTLLESADCGKDLVLIHDPSSFKLLWKEVSDLSATKWVVTECTFDPAACTLSWSVERG